MIKHPPEQYFIKKIILKNKVISFVSINKKLELDGMINQSIKKYNFEQISLKCKVSMVYLITLSTLYVYCIYENVYYIHCSGITDNTMLWYNNFSLISRLSGCVNT